MSVKVKFGACFPNQEWLAGPQLLAVLMMSFRVFFGVVVVLVVLVDGQGCLKIQKELHLYGAK